MAVPWQNNNMLLNAANMQPKFVMTCKPLAEHLWTGNVDHETTVWKQNKLWQSIL